MNTKNRKHPKVPSIFWNPATTFSAASGFIRRFGHRKRGTFAFALFASHNSVLHCCEKCLLTLPTLGAPRTLLRLRLVRPATRGGRRVLRLQALKHNTSKRLFASQKRKHPQGCFLFWNPATTYPPKPWWLSTFGAIELNFCVRYGNRWILYAIITGMAI